MEPAVSLIIPNRNNEPALDLVFERLAEHTTYPRVEVVVVDDGSEDASRAILRRWRSSGRFERFVYEERLAAGVAPALNRCLELASGELCVQLDADATVETPGWLEKLVAFFVSDQRVGAVSPRVVLDSGPVHAYGVNVVGPLGLHDRGTRVTERAGRRTLHDHVERLAPDAAPGGERIAEVDAGMGCCMLYRREDALAVGGYDTGFHPVWLDDVDLALRIRHRLGKKVFFLPDVLVLHRVTLRDTRGAPPRREVIEAQVGRVLPPPLKRFVKQRLGVGGVPREMRERLERHYAYWERKWGWHPLNPDLDAIRARYGDTEICWSGRPEAGEAIAEAFAPRRAELLALTPYDHLLDVLRNGLPPGDVVEIGAFVGGGVAQLARAAPGRRVIAVDLFAPGADPTVNTAGAAMAGIYGHVLGGRSQRALYDAVTAGLPNVVTVAGDSAEVDLPTGAIAFAHVDGNHGPAYVRGDFEKVWARTVPGGVVAFDDYGHDLPGVTRTVDALRAERRDEIAAFWVAGEKTAFVRKA